MKKKIFFILPSIGFGGAEKVYIEIAAKLSEFENYDVKLIYMTNSKGERSLPKGLKFKCFNVSSIKAGFFKVAKFLKKEKPNIVFSGLSHLNFMMIVMKKIYKFNFKLYVRHTFILSEAVKKSKTKYYQLHRLYKYADGVIFQSHYMFEDFIKVIPLDNTYIIGNPVNIPMMNKCIEQSKSKEFPTNKNERFFLFVGRLNQVKQVNYLINSFNQYSQKENVKLIILGDGPEKGNLNKLIQELKLGNNVKLIGPKKNPFPYMKYCEALLLCSKSEGFPNVVIESLGLDTPVFIRKHKGGTREILQNLNLTKYFLDNLNFNEMDQMLKGYPKCLSNNVKTFYGIDSIVKKYEKIIGL